MVCRPSDEPMTMVKLILLSAENRHKCQHLFWRIAFPVESPARFIAQSLGAYQPCHSLSVSPLFITTVPPWIVSGVSYELCDPPNSVGSPNSLVGYSIRLENNISRHTRLAFVTNGIALRMLEGGSGHSGHDTAFDEITVLGPTSFVSSHINDIYSILLSMK